MERLAEVSEQEVQIDFVLGSKCRANVRLSSLSASSPVAFKVQTSSPHKFLVNPPSGLIPPLSFATFQVILKPQSQIPPIFPRSPSDRFLVKTALAPALSHNSSDSTSPEFISSWFKSRAHESASHDLKLKVAFVGPFLLRHAVAGGDIDAVRKIIKRQRSVVPGLSTREAESLLRVASALGNSVDMVNLLVEAGLKANARARLGDVGESRWVEARSPLDLEEASKGHERYPRMLMGAGEDVNARSKNGQMALYREEANGDRRMVDMLIEVGADPTINAMDRGRSALDVARNKRHEEVVEIQKRGEAVLDAARRGDLRHLDSLLHGGGVSISFHDQYGLTALHVAAIKGHKDVVAKLLQFGSDLECPDNEGHTPLHLAVEGGHPETVEVLINRGANVNAKSKMGATPLYMARAMGYDDISQVLVERGASSSSLPCTSSSSLPSTAQAATELLEASLLTWGGG